MSSLSASWEPEEKGPEQLELMLAKKSITMVKQPSTWQRRGELAASS